ncbi:choline kinase [Legionella gratiana]|uniref:Choline kinase n=1 Tax=Legionella gratiana TaxID=45066 RepID=A0A378J957_9GAMM|nr:phosphotransferase [Legionella gratiana]KTD11183.1 choline kinase [Legionella gratiana]STX44312.1 choline kinase [Legionella gratiana]
MKWHFFGKNGGKPKISEHLMIYILSLLDPSSQFNASLVNHKWKDLVDLTRKYMTLLPTIQKIPMLSTLGLDVLRLKLMAGGMTNTTYRVQIGPDVAKLLSRISGMNPLLIERHKANRWVLRIPGEVSSFSVSREHEAKNARQASALGLNVPIEYFDPKGLQLTKFIENVKILDKKTLERAEILQTLATMAKQLHSSERFTNDTAVFERNEGLLNALKIKKFPFPGEVKFIEEQMMALRDLFSAYKIEMCPCHNDSTPLNYMMTREKDKKELFYQIDWEYSSNNDFLWDLAYFSIEAKLDKEQELTYLTAYFGQEKLTDTVFAWYTAYKPVVEWWITLWSWTQLANEAKSVDPEAYAQLGLERYQKTLMHLQSDEYKNALAVIDTDRMVPSFSGLRSF